MGVPLVFGLEDPIQRRLRTETGEWEDELRFSAFSSIHTSVSPSRIQQGASETAITFDTLVGYVSDNVLTDSIITAFDTSGVALGDTNTWLFDGALPEYFKGLSEEYGSFHESLRSGNRAALVVLAQVVWNIMTVPEVREYEAAETTAQTERVDIGRRRGKSRQSDVTVVDIRPRVSGRPTAQHGGIEHDFRWTVREHYRNQPYGPGRRFRRRIKIAAHEAGPPDKPLRKHTVVHRLTEFSDGSLEDAK